MLPAEIAVHRALAVVFQGVVGDCAPECSALFSGTYGLSSSRSCSTGGRGGTSCRILSTLLKSLWHRRPGSASRRQWSRRRRSARSIAAVPGAFRPRTCQPSRRPSSVDGSKSARATSPLAWKASTADSNEKRKDEAAQACRAPRRTTFSTSCRASRRAAVRGRTRRPPTRCASCIAARTFATPAIAVTFGSPVGIQTNAKT